MISKVYLAGPMTGIPGFNYPRFDNVAEDLRAKGYDVVSPAEMDTPHVREIASSSPDGCAERFLATLEAQGYPRETWGDFLSRDVKIVADEVEGVVLLEDWHKSKGARLEAFVATLTGKPCFEYRPGYKCGAYRDVVECSPRYVMNQIAKNTGG